MSRNNNNDDKLLIWGLILIFTGVGSGIGIALLIAYGIKRASAKNRGLGDIIKDNIQKNFSAKIEYDQTGAKIIYADKVETVETKTNNEIKKESVSKQNTNSSSEEYTTQEILDKLDYYSEHTDLNNEQILEKISLLNKMLLSLAPKIDKTELQNDIKDINKIIEKMLKTLKNKKSKIKNINNFATYYLPVTLKILIKYDEVENLKLNTNNSKEFMSTVEEKIKMIKTSFQNQLESLYMDDFDDVEAELNVLETMLKSDGYTDIDDFNLRKKSE